MFVLPLVLFLLLHRFLPWFALLWTDSDRRTEMGISAH
jgi:hypothetical protein